MLIFLVPLGLVRFSREDFSISLMDGKGLCASTLQAKKGKGFKHSESTHSLDHPCFGAVPLPSTVPSVP